MGLAWWCKPSFLVNVLTRGFTGKSEKRKLVLTLVLPRKIGWGFHCYWLPSPGSEFGYGKCLRKVFLLFGWSTKNWPWLKQVHEIIVMRRRVMRRGIIMIIMGSSIRSVGRIAVSQVVKTYPWVWVKTYDKHTYKHTWGNNHPFTSHFRVPSGCHLFQSTQPPSKVTQDGPKRFRSIPYSEASTATSFHADTGSEVVWWTGRLSHCMALHILHSRLHYSHADRQTDRHTNVDVQTHTGIPYIIRIYIYM